MLEPERAVISTALVPSPVFEADSRWLVLQDHRESAEGGQRKALAKKIPVLHCGCLK
jgi:hypothetical protein